ncbi:MAG: phosphopantothenoylcysteine decarboxylase [Bdellovibrionota bacterium]
MSKLPRVLITGGPTRAYLDRVRFLSNVSSGELAFRLCTRLRAHRARVAAVVGPNCFDFKRLKLAHYAPVETTEEMAAAVYKLCRQFKPDYAVFSAAVLDFVPAERLEGKVTSKGDWTVRLKPSAKIIDEVAARFPKIKRIGFKLEWEPHEDKAEWGAKLLEEKGLDVLCLNYLSQISKKSHPAYLFSNGNKMARAKTKKEIADWLTWYIFANQMT